MKKGLLLMLAALSVMVLVVWFSCNPFQASEGSSSNLNVLDSADAVKATQIQGEGYCTMNGGTSGGSGGRVVTVNNGTDLCNEVLGATPVIIYVTGTITLNNTDENVLYVKRVSDVSIIGQGADFNGIGFKCEDSHNIIFQNLRIHHTENSENGDGIEIAESTNVLVDHCEFYNDSPSVNSDKDKYDGLVDVKKGSEYVTIQWCYFHDHWKGCLVGHSDSQSGDTALKVTYHHNYFKNINSRLPLIRYGRVHMYNNYLVDILDSGTNCRMGCQVRIDNQVYERVGSGEIDGDTGYAKGPIGWFYGSDETGYWNISGVQYINCLGNQPTSSTCSFTPPYSYSTDPTSSVKSIVMAGAGLL